MTTVWAFIIIIGVLITIHEFGHFIAARSVGVKVERFSIVPLIRKAADSGKIGGLIFEKSWHDVGTPERLREINLK